MNHLVGLDVECPTKSLSATDAATLAAFRGAHEAAKPTDFLDGHEGNSTSSSRSGGSSLQTSAHEVDPATLPPCGWRPLDDATLYRFLCADRRNGKFQPDKSRERLARALSFRKEEGVDGILKSADAAACSSSTSTSTAAKEGQTETPPIKKGPSPRSVGVASAYDRSDSVASLTSIASGIISDCGEKVHKVVVASPSPKELQRPPLSPPTEDGEDANMDSTAHSSSDSAATATTPSAAAAMCPRELERYQRLRVRVFVGRDHHGQPVLFERLGHFLGSGNCDHFSEEEWIRFYIWDLERHFAEMRRASEDCGRAITRFTYVADADGIVSGIMNRAVWRVIPLLKALVKAVEEHYPEIADKIVLFNVPRIASVFYRAVRTFLDPITAEKIELHSGIPTAEFERIMPKSVVPIEYGGTNDVEFPPAVTAA